MSSPPTGHSLVHLAREHQVGAGAGERGGASDAGGVADGQDHALTHPLVLRLLLAPGELQ